MDSAIALGLAGALLFITLVAALILTTTTTHHGDGEKYDDALDSLEGKDEYSFDDLSKAYSLSMKIDARFYPDLKRRANELYYKIRHEFS